MFNFYLNNQEYYLIEPQELPRFIIPKTEEFFTPEPVKNCQPIEKLAFAKTHKTGGSTLQNIFMRYGYFHYLTFALPTKSWMFSFNEPFNAKMVTNYTWNPEHQFDMMVFHSLWNGTEVDKVIPRDKSKVRICLHLLLSLSRQDLPKLRLYLVIFRIHLLTFRIHLFSFKMYFLTFRIHLLTFTVYICIHSGCIFLRLEYICFHSTCICEHLCRIHLLVSRIHLFTFPNVNSKL